MRIMFRSPISRGQVKEGSAFTVTAKFYDDSSDPWTLSAPSTIRYKICGPDVNTIIDWTTVSAASSVSIAVTGTANAIQCGNMMYETHELIVQANAGLDTQYSESFHWIVNNLAGLP